MSTFRQQATFRSALWAAYGDALGFMTELAKDKSTVKYRTGHEKITALVPWKRMIGGVYGASVELFAGSYSDDTQLRLSTSRAINQYGFFDVEAFAKFELTVWQAYALGAGRGTKSATQSLTQKNRNWFNNFYSVKNSEYVNGGGNGAAMRIQPHVWAAPNLSNPESYLVDVVKNSITTHGHPRGIAGAVFHAATLASLLNGSQITFSTLKQIALSCKEIPKLIYSDDYLSSIWLPEWEELSHIDVETAFERISDELIADLLIAEPWLLNSTISYEELIHSLQLDTPEQRGSGTKTALIASLLTLKLSSFHIQELMIDIVNNISTDTDTIATMFGALAGVIVSELPMEEVQDQHYIKSDAQRLYQLSQGKEIEGFSYPDFTQWSPERSAVANTLIQNNIYELNGFGVVTPISSTFHGRQKGFYYQWFSVESGFTLLLKIKSQNVGEGEDKHSLPDEKNKIESGVNRKEQMNEEHCKQQSLILIQPEPNDKPKLDIDSLTKEVIQGNFDPKTIGEHILILLQKEELAIESVVSYSSIVAKAKISRDKKVKK